MRFQTNTKTQEKQPTTKEKIVESVLSISAALNENLAALQRPHTPLPMYFQFLLFFIKEVNNHSFLDTQGSLSFNNYIILRVLNTIHHISKFGYFFFTYSKNTSFSFFGNKLPSWHVGNTQK